MRVWLTVLLSALLLPASAVPCLADTPKKDDVQAESEPPGPAKTGEHKEGAHGERSMFERALDLGIWTIFVFLLLFGILYKFAWQQMLEGLARPERDIAAAVEDARKAREEAAEARKQLQEEIARGHEKVRQMLEEARKDAERLAHDREAQAEAKIEADRQRHLREISV